MEGIQKQERKVIDRCTRHPHVIIFCFLLFFSISLNGILISSMGLPIFLDSLMNPADYEIISSEQLRILEQSNTGSAALIQKQTHPSFSIDQKDILCSLDLSGFYTIEQSSLDQNNSTNAIDIIGKVITFIPSNSINSIAFSWWQQTKGFVQHFKS
jgi:hypothetical protein